LTFFGFLGTSPKLEHCIQGAATNLVVEIAKVIYFKDLQRGFRKQSITTRYFPLKKTLKIKTLLPPLCER
jgi:hypothetical protein